MQVKLYSVIVHRTKKTPWGIYRAAFAMQHS